MSILPKHLPFIIPFTAIACLTGCFESSAGTDQAGAMRGIRPDAELAGFFDLKALRDSKINQLFEAKYPDQVQDLEDLGPIGQKIKEITGLSRTNFVSASFSVTNLIALGEDDFDNGFLLASIKVNKPLTGKQIKEAFEAIAAENGEAIDLTIETRGGIDFIEIPRQPMAPDFHAAVESGENGALVFIGDRSSVVAAATGTLAGASGSLVERGSSMLPNSDGWITFVASDGVKEKLKEGLSGGQMPFPGAAALVGFQAIGMSMAADSSLEIKVALELANENDALTVQGLLNGLVIAMAKGQIQQQFGKLPSFMEQLTASVDKASVSLGTTFSAEDLEFLSNLNPGM